MFLKSVDVYTFETFQMFQICFKYPALPPGPQGPPIKDTEQKVSREGWGREGLDIFNIVIFVSVDKIPVGGWGRGVA